MSGTKKTIEWDLVGSMHDALVHSEGKLKLRETHKELSEETDLKLKAIKGNPIVTFDKNGFPLSAEQRAKLEPIPPLQTTGPGGGGEGKSTLCGGTVGGASHKCLAIPGSYAYGILAGSDAHAGEGGAVTVVNLPHPITGGDALHFDAGKPPLSMIPREALELEAQAFAYGAKKYSRNNYQKGMEWTKLIDSVLRHVNAFSGKEDIDPESGLSHLAHARASLAMLVYHLKHHPGKDDR